MQRSKRSVVAAIIGMLLIVPVHILIVVSGLARLMVQPLNNRFLAYPASGIYVIYGTNVVFDLISLAVSALVFLLAAGWCSVPNWRIGLRWSVPVCLIGLALAYSFYPSNPSLTDPWVLVLRIGLPFVQMLAFIAAVAVHQRLMGHRIDH